MANEVKLPRLGQGMEAGTITKWLKAPGETVEKGEPLFEIDTDKVTQEVESGAVAAPSAPGAAAAAVPSGEIESVPLTSIRKTIARRLTAAWQAPVFQLTVSADMTRANELVARNRELNPDVRVTVTDLLAKVCAQALMRHRDVNVQYTGDALLKFPTATVGIA